MAKATNTTKPTEHDWSNIDPDDLFVQFTIPEIRNIQAKLRADADAKQAELRLMVGDRYRDLLQASTSIISIAESSKHVIDALTEMREAMAPDEHERKPRSLSIRGKEDTHLEMLQSLSAHLKLLLDTPEHLWRLLEKKQHLQAAWLFLLARVVYRALVTEDPDESWERRGIDVLSQFPLAQRQWETVTQFRSQIAHKATQYLREHSMSSETACSTILTVYLLDSLPLPETLSTLLSQRARTLNALLSRKISLHETSRPGSPTSKNQQKAHDVAGQPLGSPGITIRTWARLRDDVVKGVRDAILESLDVISGTLCIARDIFRVDDSGKSLIERSLEGLQMETSPTAGLTTPSLLSRLPSSTHLLNLPQSILSYKPYIDLTSPNTRVDADHLDTKLSVWFDKAVQGFEGRIHAWFNGLETIRETWSVRRKVLEKLQATRGMEETEILKVRTVLDEAVKCRASDISSEALKGAEEAVDNALRRSIQDVRGEAEGTQLEVSPSAFLFSPPPVAFLSQLSTNADLSMASFKSFKDALRQRADGRTPTLHRLLGNIESKARELEEDLDAMSDNDQASRQLREQLMTSHYPKAQLSLKRIIENMERLISSESAHVGGSEKSIGVIIFLGRIFHSMSSSSFGQSLRCRDEVLQDFRDALEVLYRQTLSHWKTHAVSKASELYAPVITALKGTNQVAGDSSDFAWPFQPNPHLIHALLLLTSFLQALGLPRETSYSMSIASNVVRGLTVSIADAISVDGLTWRQEHAQLLWDLTLLRRLSYMHNDASERSHDTEDAFDTKVALLQSRLRSNSQDETFLEFSSHIDRTIDQYISRCQLLLAPFVGTTVPSKKTITNGNSTERLPSASHKPTALLPLGTPLADQDFKPGMEIVKPSARFALLLVGSTTM